MKIIDIVLDGQPMVVCTNSEQKAMVSDNAPHAHYCLNRADVLADASAFKEMCKHLQKSEVNTVLELFGGCGWHSAIIQKTFNPKIHLTCDISADCVESIQRSLPGVRALECDSYFLLKRYRDMLRWDWVHSDFNQYTHKRGEVEPYRSAIYNIFSCSKKYVTITDSAVFGLVRFPKNRASYSSAIGMDVNDWRDYYRAVAEIIFSRYGFGLRHVIVWHRMASMMLFERGAQINYELMEQKTKLSLVIKGARKI
jgi:hypothetical protein